MLYNFTHAHIRDLRPQLPTEEKRANLPKLIGRPLKMIRIEGAVTEGGGGEGLLKPQQQQKVAAVSEAPFVHSVR